MDRYLLLAALALAALFCWPGTARSELTLPSRFSTVTLAAGLADPTALAYAPDGRMFIAEKAGRLRVVGADGVLARAPVIDISGHTATQGDRGLLGLALDSGFATNGIVYLLYTYDRDQAHPIDAKTARLTRIKVLPDNTVVSPQTPETVLLGSDGDAPCPLPANASDCIPSTSDSHTIGTVRADPDGTLWVGAGDGAQYNRMDLDALRALDERSLAGKLLHIDRNGRGLPGHKFCPDEDDLTLVCTKLYARGLRNPFRFQLRPGVGPIAGDVGWDLTEELNSVEDGKSYGWPCYEGSAQTFNYQDLTECQAEYEIEPPAHTPPIYSYSHSNGEDHIGGAVVAGPRYTATQYPAVYHGAWFVADYVQGWVRYYDLVDGQAANVGTLVSAGFSGVDLETTPDGDLVYVNFGDGSANSGSIERIVYGNAPPTAAAHATPQSGGSPLFVEFSADVSVDPDGDDVTYGWDFESDGIQDAEGRTATHVYAESGAHTATLTVRDSHGLAGHAEVVVAVDETVPVATIEAPTHDALFRHGVPVALRGTGEDHEDGTLTGDALRWRIVLHHGEHIHLVGPELKGAEQSFTPAGDHDADSYYEIQFTATDSAGLKHTRTVNIRPETIKLTLDSSPPGVPLSYSGREYVAPTALTSAIGYRTSVSAPATVSRAGTLYRFTGWSDGGARLHDLVVPAADRTLIARYEAVPRPPAPAGVAAGAQAAPQSVPAEPIRPRVRLRLDRPRRHPRVLAGQVLGTATAPRVLVALRTARSGGRCRRWSTDLDGLGRPITHCGRHFWMRARVTRAGASSWRWRVRLGGTARRGRYVLTTRVTDNHGSTLLGPSALTLRLR